MFEKCLPSNTAIFLFIFVTFCLSLSDAGSDIALSYYLYSRFEILSETLFHIYYSEGSCTTP